MLTSEEDIFQVKTPKKNSVRCRKIRQVGEFIWENFVFNIQNVNPFYADIKRSKIYNVCLV